MDHRGPRETFAESQGRGELEELAALISLRIGTWQEPGYENPPDSPCEDCPHGRTAHLTRAPSQPEPYHCSACGCRQYRGAHCATIPPLGERSAAAIKAGHEAVRDIDALIARLHEVRARLVSELRADEDIRMARVP
jgi:hypothetical protein